MGFHQIALGKSLSKKTVVALQSAIASDTTKVIRSEWHSIFLVEDQGLAAKEYPSAEQLTALKNLYVGTMIRSESGVRCLALLVDDSRSYLVMPILQSSDQPYEAVIRQAISSLRIFHGDLENMPVDGEGAFRPEDEVTKKYLELHPEAHISSVNYPLEFLFRAVNARKGDRHFRLSRCPSGFIDYVRGMYIELFNRTPKPVIIHGDARLANYSEDKFVDYDHVRFGPTEYDFGRLVANKSPLSFQDLGVLVRACDLDTEFFWKNFLHHSLTLAGYSLGVGIESDYNKYRRMSIDASVVLGLKELAAQLDAHLPKSG